MFAFSSSKITENTVKIEKNFTLELLMYQDSVIAFALKYKTNDHKIKKLFIRDCSLLCFMLLSCLYFLLCAFTIQDMLSLFIFLFPPRLSCFYFKIITSFPIFRKQHLLHFFPHCTVK